MKPNRLFLIMLIVFSILILVPFVVYVIRFRSYSISNNPEDWHSFFSFYISLLGLLLSGIIAKLVNDISIKTNQTEKQYDAYKVLIDIIAKFSFYKFLNCSYSEALETIRINRQEYKEMTKKFGFLFNDYQNYYSNLQKAIQTFENYCLNIGTGAETMSVSEDSNYMMHLVKIKKCLNRLTKVLQNNMS